MLTAKRLENKRSCQHNYTFQKMTCYHYEKLLYWKEFTRYFWVYKELSNIVNFSDILAFMTITWHNGIYLRLKKVRPSICEWTDNVAPRKGLQRSHRKQQTCCETNKELVEQFLVLYPPCSYFLWNCIDIQKTCYHQQTLIQKRGHPTNER